MNGTDSSMVWLNVAKYQMYTLEGGGIAVANTLIVITVLWQKELRAKKEYIVVAGLAFTDALSGMGYFMAGIYRSYLLVNDLAGEKASAWECFLTPHNWFFVLAHTPSGVALIMVTLDRLIAVSHPIKYFTYTSAYAWKLVGCFMAYFLVDYFIGVTISFIQTSERLYSRMCILPDVFGKNQFWRIWNFLQRSLGGVVSVLLYVVVLVKTRKILFSVQPNSDRQTAERIARMRKVNVTIGICTGCTLFLFCIPNAIWAIIENFAENPRQYIAFGTAIMLISNINPFINIFIYTIRHKELRAGMKYTLKGHQMTTQEMKQLTQPSQSAKITSTSTPAAKA